MTDNEVIDIPFISFHHYENISSFLLHTQLLPDHRNNFLLGLGYNNLSKGRLLNQIVLY